MIKSIRKREGNIVKFEENKITNAVLSAMIAIGNKNTNTAENIN